MAKKTSAGCVVYKLLKTDLKVLLVHPSGNYNQDAYWSIPKGGLDPKETPKEAAVRETWEETGVKIEADLTSLDEVVYKSGKKVYGFAVEAGKGCKPFCASWEVDKVEFFSISEAELKILPAQKPFLKRLKKLVGFE